MENIDIQTDYNDNGHYVTISYNKEDYNDDSEIASFLGMTKDKYQGLLKNKFKYKIIDDDIYFANYKKAKRFEDWLKENVEYYLVMKNLVPNIMIGE